MPRLSKVIGGMGLVIPIAAALFMFGPTAAKDAEFVKIDGGSFSMGSASHYQEERAVRTVSVGAYSIGRHEVTNAQFAAFVKATGYVTTAERGIGDEHHRNWPPELRKPGSMVFAEPGESVDLADNRLWWRYVPGASWRHPTGPHSNVEGLDHHPVVQVSPEDAEAYAAWAGGRLPTEAEWEFAARGGLNGAAFTWGEMEDAAGGWKANTWQGPFPAVDLKEDGYHGTSPVGSFPPNGYGLFDMAGNVWEHVADWWVPAHPTVDQQNPKGPPQALALHFAHPETGPMRVIKGGSWLCAPSFCMRDRPAARQPFERSLGSNHIGFRIVKSVGAGG